MREARGEWKGALWVALLAAGLSFLPAIRAADLGVLDLEFRILRALERSSAESNVVVVGIDDQTTHELREPLALWHLHLADFSRFMALARPSVVGIDLVLPDRSYDFLLPGYDERLLRGLAELKQVAPVVLALTVDAEGELRTIFPPYLSVAGPDSTGYALFARDADTVVRRFAEDLGEDGERVSTFVGQMARRLGLEPQAGIIDYTAGSPFNYVPLHEVLRWGRRGDIDALRQKFEGRPVILGSVIPLLDREYQPVELAEWEPGEHFTPAVLIHAQALRSILGNGLITPASVPVIYALQLLALSLWFLVRGPGSALLWFSGFAALLLVASTAALGAGREIPVAAAICTAVIASGGKATQTIAARMLERRRLRRGFAGAVSPQVLEAILAGQLPETARRQACVLFSDIRGFTSRCESMAPEDVISFLNEYFEVMTPPIHQNGGTIDKFIGDGLMAFFGAPNQLENPSESAFDAAREMLERLLGFNAELQERALAPVQIGIGLHCGEIVVGQLGSSSRREYTAVGDVVNSAARLESLTKEQGFPVVCSKEFVEALGRPEEFEWLGEVPVRGRASMALWGWPRSTPMNPGAEAV